MIRLIVYPLILVTALLSEHAFLNGRTYRVVDMPGYEVSWGHNELTRFDLPEGYAVGLLAHEEQAGRAIKKLRIGDLIFYRGLWVVTDRRVYLSHDPENVYANFTDLTNGNVLSSTDLVNEIYKTGLLVLQTCEGEGGRLFVITERIGNDRHTISRHQRQLAATPD